MFFKVQVLIHTAEKVISDKSDFIYSYMMAFSFQEARLTLIFQDSEMKRKGCSILFINETEQVLLCLRDDNPLITCPGMWDVPGGHVEPGETPEQCITREMKEEMELDLEDFRLFSVMEFSDRIEYTFWKRADLDVDRIILHEGQELRWFTETEVAGTELAYGFNEIVADFFKARPFSTP